MHVSPLTFPSPINQSPCFDVTGKWLGSRQIRCNWAAKGATNNDEKQSVDSKSVVELTSGTSGELSLRIEVLICILAN